MERHGDPLYVAVFRKCVRACIVTGIVTTASMLVFGGGCTVAPEAAGVDIKALHWEYLRYELFGDAEGRMGDFTYVGTVTDHDGNHYRLAYVNFEWCTAAPPDCPENWCWHGTHKLLIYDIQGDFMGSFRMEYIPRKFVVEKNAISYTSDDRRVIVLSFEDGFPKMLYEKKGKQPLGLFMPVLEYREAKRREWENRK